MNAETSTLTKQVSILPDAIPEASNLQVVSPPQATAPHIAHSTPTQPASPDSLLVMAMQSGASIETLERLLTLKERHDANVARQAYTEDMAKAKRTIPTIKKNKHVAYASKGGVTQYDHATLGNIINLIVPWLAEYGFSHRWDVRQQGTQISVTCTVTHKLGHCEQVTMFAARDDSGGKNDIQALGSTTSYLERYTVMAITGLATEDQDDDGAAGGARIMTPTEINRLDASTKVKRCQTREELEAVTKACVKKFNELRDHFGYQDFRKEVQAKGAELPKQELAHA